MIDLRAIETSVVPADRRLFFTRNDATDPRMGERTVTDLAAIPDAARIALVGVPQDIGVARNGGRVGAAMAPDAIRAALYRLTPFDITTRRAVPDGFLVDVGDVRIDGELEAIHDRLRDVVHRLCERGLIPLVLGGGHDVTYAAATGACAAVGTLGLVNVDAHLDVRPQAPLRNSGTSFRMLLEEESVAASRFVELGIQSFAVAEAHVAWVTERGGTILPLGEIHRLGMAGALDAACAIACAGGGPLYGTLDMDAVRAADAPGVSAPMPDGISAHDLLVAARAFGEHAATAALDIVEVNPTYDRDGCTAKLAAHAVMQFVIGVASRR